MSTQPEAQLSREIMDYIRARGGWAIKIHGGPLTTAGVPDIVACYRGRYLALETKMPGNKATPVQLHRMRQIRKAGGIAQVVRSKEDISKLLNELYYEDAKKPRP
jgi:Holliday junction resolvase